MKSYIIHLVRHGMTEGNQTGRYVGSTDCELNTDGIKQLQELREKYDYEHPELIFSSPMKRCHQTINELFGDVDIIDVDGIRECNMGDFEGKTAQELTDKPEFINWVQKGEAPPNGESNKEFATRVCTAFVDTVREILKSGKTSAVICAHGGVIMTLLAVYGLPQQDMIEWMANNGRGFTIRVTPSIWMRTGMVEVVSEYPFGSADEPDLSINPVKNNKQSFVSQSDEADEYADEEYDQYDDEFSDETADVFWADAEPEDNSSKK